MSVTVGRIGQVATAAVSMVSATAVANLLGRVAAGAGMLGERDGGDIGFRRLRNLAMRVAAIRGRWATIGTLSEMSDRELVDIGLSRSAIDRVFDPDFARRPARRAAADLEEWVLADLGLSRILPRPTAGSWDTTAEECLEPCPVCPNDGQKPQTEEKCL